MKPVVHFLGQVEFQPAYNVDTGDDTEVAHVYAVDHPRLGKGVIRTSRIVKKFSDGSFETLNTVYRPAKT